VPVPGLGPRTWRSPKSRPFSRTALRPPPFFASSGHVLGLFKSRWHRIPENAVVGRLAPPSPRPPDRRESASPRRGPIARAAQARLGRASLRPFEAAPIQQVTAAPVSPALAPPCRKVSATWRVFFRCPRRAPPTLFRGTKPLPYGARRRATNPGAPFEANLQRSCGCSFVSLMPRRSYTMPNPTPEAPRVCGLRCGSFPGERRLPGEGPGPRAPERQWASARLVPFIGTKPRGLTATQAGRNSPFPAFFPE